MPQQRASTKPHARFFAPHTLAQATCQYADADIHRTIVKSSCDSHNSKVHVSAVSMARLVLDQLTKIYRAHNGESVTAVRDLNLTVADKELLVIRGPSGSGKTTTLRLIAGLEEPSRGTISMDREMINERKPHERDIAMVFQGDALFPHLSAYDNIALGLR